MNEHKRIEIVEDVRAENPENKAIVNNVTIRQCAFCLPLGTNELYLHFSALTIRDKHQRRRTNCLPTNFQRIRFNYTTTIDPDHFNFSLLLVDTSNFCAKIHCQFASHFLLLCFALLLRLHFIFQFEFCSTCHFRATPTF